MSIRLSEITGDIVLGSGERLKVDTDGELTLNGRAAWVGTIPSSGQASIVERGSNANGTYVRFADGTQFCSHVVTTSGSADVSWTFPAAFSTTDNLGLFGNVPTATTNSYVVTYSGTGTTSISNIRTVTASNTRETINARLTAIGRWY